MTTSNPIPDPVREEPQAPHIPADPSLAPAEAPQKQERDYLVIGLIVALMAMTVAGFFALDGKIDALETSLNGRIDDLITGDGCPGNNAERPNRRPDHQDGCPGNTLNGRIDALSARMDALEAALNARIDGLYELMFSLKA